MTEKQTTERMAQIYKAVQRAGSVSLYCHTNPDGDTLCCALALRRALISMNKTVDVFCDGEIPKKYQSLPDVQNITLPNKGTHDLAIALDCSDLDRLGGAMKSYLSAKGQIVIDHHLTHMKFGDISLVQPEAAACAEIIYDLLSYMKSIDDVTAELIFSGIVADTGCFQFSSTTARTHEIAFNLIQKYSFDASGVVYRLQKRTTPEVFKLKIKVLNNCKLFLDGKVAIITFKQTDFDQTGTTSSDTEGIIIDVIDIDGVEIAFALTEVNDKSYRISVRTKNYVNAADLAAEFGGGGHVRASGLRLSGFYEDIIDKLLKSSRDRL